MKVIGKPAQLKQLSPRRLTESPDGTISVVDSYLTTKGLGLAQARALDYPSGVSLTIPERTIEILETTERTLEVVTITWTYTPDENGSNQPGEGEDHSPFDVEITSTVSEEPLTVHPLYKPVIDQLSPDDLALLSSLMSGQLTDEAGTRIDQQLAGKIPADFIKKIMSGQTHYYAPRIQVVLTYNRGAAPNIAAGVIASNLVGLPSLPAPMRWLSMGAGKSQKQGKRTSTITLLGGEWDPDIYP